MHQIWSELCKIFSACEAKHVQNVVHLITSDHSDGGLAQAEEFADDIDKEKRTWHYYMVL